MPTEGLELVLEVGDVLVGGEGLLEIQFLKTSKYIWDPARGGVLEGGDGGGGLPPPGTAAVSKHQTISGTQHEGACSNPPPPARLLCPSIRQ